MAPPPLSPSFPPPKFKRRPLMPLNRRVSYTAVRLGEEDAYHSDATPPTSPLLAPPVSQQQQQLSSPQQKFEDTFPSRAGSRRGSTFAPTGSRTRSLVGWALTAIPLAGTAILLFLAVRSPQLRGIVTLRSPHHIYLYATPFVHERPYETHPIHELMQEAEKLWQDKVARQSKSYKEAVAEYQRRHSRAPPRGFEAWYEWAVNNDVQLIDEYDHIYHHIEPFHSLPIAELHHRISRLSDPEGDGHDHEILTLRGGKRHYSGAKWRTPVGESFDGLLEGISHLLPDMVVPLYLHDASHTQMDWEWMQAYRKAAREGKMIDESTLPPLHRENGWSLRQRTCAPDSRYRLASMGLENHVPPAGPSFVRSHKNNMEYCENPAIVNLHGATSVGISLRRLEPSFAMSRTEIDGDIVWPSTIQYNLNPENEKPFLEKPVHKILWRGSPDGIWVGPENKWRESQRFRLLYLTNSNSSSPRKLRRTSLDRLGREYQVDEMTSLSALNKRYSNIKPTNGPVQCREELCEYLRETMEFVPKASLEEMGGHRFVMDVDGNAYSARFRTHLMSNQVPLKATIYKEWYYDRIQPWYHYVPVKQDYSDLYNILAFFDGGLDAARTGHHDLLGEKIARQGREWAEGNWREVDMRSYVFRLLLEYARLFDPAQRGSEAEEWSEVGERRM